MIWNKARECMSRDELSALQGKRLVGLVKYMYDNEGYYRKKMRKTGLEPKDIRGIEDLEKLPFTTREDLTEAYPLGVFAMSCSKIVHYQPSDHGAGFAGMETVAGYTQGDIRIWQECMARSISMAGLGEKDVVQIAHDCGLGTDSLGSYYGAGKVGAAVISAPGCRPAMSVALMRRLQVTGFISTSSNLMRVAQVVEERGMKDALRLKAAICGGASWTENMRRKIQDRLGFRVYDIFGLNELTGPGVACECTCQKGLHIQEDFFLTEILDTHSLRALPGGTMGELVFTTLQKEGIPLVRYRTKSITKIHYGKCECGRTMARMDRLCHGPDDILQVRGNDVHVSRLEAALSELQGIKASYIIRVKTEHNYDVVDVCVVADQANGMPVQGVKRMVADTVSRIIGMEPGVYCAGSGEAGAFHGIPDQEADEAYKEICERLCMGKKVAIVDERKY